MVERGEDPQAAILRRGPVCLGIQRVRLHPYERQSISTGPSVRDLATAPHRDDRSCAAGHPASVAAGQGRLPSGSPCREISAVPEVREHRFRTHRRGPPQLGPGTGWNWTGSATPSTCPRISAYRLRHVLTDLQRAVRRLTES